MEVMLSQEGHTTQWCGAAHQAAGIESASHRFHDDGPSSGTVSVLGAHLLNCSQDTEGETSVLGSQVGTAMPSRKDSCLSLVHSTGSLCHVKECI